MEIIKVSSILGAEYPDLDVCQNNGSSLKIFQWQSYGELFINDNLCLKIETDEFCDKALQFIRTSKDINASLVLTPEYSFPYKIIEKIISDNELWPNVGKLWCLGSQCELNDILEKKLKEWESKNDVIISYKSFEFTTVKKLVSPLIYIFRTRNNKLCILPQFKTGQMYDPFNEWEGENLSLGKYIYLFDKNNSDNTFLSIICADAFHITPDSIINDGLIRGKHLLIFHPQLNPSPRNNELINFRKNIIRKNSPTRIKLITLNWAEGTTISRTAHLFKKPWSAFYKSNGYILGENNNYRINKQLNHEKGTFISWDSNSHIEIWYTLRSEHCKEYSIDLGDSSGSSQIVATREEPITNNCYTFLEGEWRLPVDKYCSDVVTLFNNLGVSYTYPFPYPVCASGEERCDKCQCSDYFFGSFFGHFEESEIGIKDEFVTRVLVGSDHESDSERKIKMNNILIIKNNLDANNIPPSMNQIKNRQYNFKIYYGFPDVGKMRYNIAPIHSEQRDLEVLAVYTEKVDFDEIRKLQKDLSEKLDERFRDQILIYYNNAGQIKYFDEHLQQDRNSNPSFSKNSARISK